MFQRLKKLAANTKTLKSKLIFRIVFQNNEVQTFVLDLNRIDQIFENNEQSDGSIIPSTNSTFAKYSPVTESLNRGKSFKFKNSSTKQKIAGDPYFLFDTGEWFNTFKVKVLDDGFVIQATDVHGVDYKAEYGDKILGLNNESKNEIIKKIIPFIIQETRKIIRG